MLAIFNSSSTHNLPIRLILVILVSKFMVHRALSDKIYLSLGLLSPLSRHFVRIHICIRETTFQASIFLAMSFISKVLAE